MENTELGLCMRNNMEMFRNCLNAVPPRERFVYVEIGIYNGDTIKLVAEHLSKSRPAFIAFAVEAPFWVEQNSRVASQRMGEWWDGRALSDPLIEGDIDRLKPNKIHVLPIGSGAFLKDSGVRPDAVFIDGCHSAKCTMMDFVLCELVMSAGGVVMLHDIDPGYQGLDDQYHCKSKIQVLAACEKLKLLPVLQRPGWKTIGQSKEGFETHSLLVLQKTG